MNTNTNTNAISLEPIVRDLNTMYAGLNTKLFDGKLSPVVITVSPDITKGAYGWFTTAKVWKTSDMDDKIKQGNFANGYHEINLCAEHLARPIAEVVETLLHEMVHQYNFEQGVKDTSRNGWYHNEAYRKAAEAHGLTVTKSAKYGWCETKLTEDLAKWAEDNFTKFDLQRRVLEKAKRKTVKSHSIKYTCPCCGNSVRATKAVNIRCADCDIMMEE